MKAVDIERKGIKNGMRKEKGERNIVNRKMKEKIV